MSRRRALAVALLAALALPLFGVPARAMVASVVIEEDRAIMTATITANLTAVPRGECDWYEGFHGVWQNPALRSGFEDATRVHIENYLRSVLGLKNVAVEDLDLEFSLSKGYYTYAVYPSAAANATGALVSGSVANLTAADGVAMRFRSLNDTNTMYIVVDINMTLPDWVPADKLTNFTITVVGNLSKTVSEEASVALYNYTSGGYDVLSATALNSTASTTAKFGIEDTGDYVKDGLVRLRINVTDVQAHPSTLVDLDLDQVKLEFRYFTVSIRVRLELLLSGVTEAAWGEKRINVKFRRMNPEGTISYGGWTFNPARLFFLNFGAFDVPLEEWERKFNGTHTTFTYTVSKVAVYTQGGYAVEIDPTESITVEGEATGSGDTIVVKVYPAVAAEWLLMGGLAVAVAAMVVLLALPKAVKHAVAEEAERRRKFVKKRG